MSDEISKTHSVIADNLVAIHNKIAAAEAAYKTQTGLDRPVTLVAVSKRQTDDRIDAALVAGQRVFGENRVQEAQGRWVPRRDRHADLTLHLIGPLQTNKRPMRSRYLMLSKWLTGPSWQRRLAMR